MVNYEEQLKVVIFYLKSLFNFLRRTKPYHLVFPTYFDLQICYLLLYYLLTCLCQPRPVYLIFIRGNCRQLLLFNGAGDETRTRTRVYLMGFSYYSMSPQPHFCVVVWSTSLPYLIQTQVAGVYSLHIYQVIYDLNLARRSVFAFAVLASFYSKGFPLGTLYDYSQPPFEWKKHIKVQGVCQFHHSGISRQDSLKSDGAAVSRGRR